jgi:hypothetical protein
MLRKLYELRNRWIQCFLGWFERFWLEKAYFRLENGVWAISGLISALQARKPLDHEYLIPLMLLPPFLIVSEALRACERRFRWFLSILMVLSGLITSRSDLYRYRTGTMQASAVRLDFRWVYSFKIKIRDLALAKYWRIARLRSWIRFGATQGAWTPSQGNQNSRDPENTWVRKNWRRSLQRLRNREFLCQTGLWKTMSEISS